MHTGTEIHLLNFNKSLLWRQRVCFRFELNELLQQLKMFFVFKKKKKREKRFTTYVRKLLHDKNNLFLHYYDLIR